MGDQDSNTMSFRALLVQVDKNLAVTQKTVETIEETQKTFVTKDAFEPVRKGHNRLVAAIVALFAAVALAGITAIGRHILEH